MKGFSTSDIQAAGNTRRRSTAMRIACIASNNEVRLGRDGYFVLDFLEPDELYDVRRRINELGFGRNSIKRLRVSVTQDSTAKRNEIFSALSPVFREPVDRCLEAYRIMRVAIFDKPAWGRGIRVHQHANLVDETRFRSLTIWIPLVATTSRMGTLNVVRGSHAFSGHVRSYDDYYCAFDGVSKRIIRKYSRPLALQAGQAAVFDDRLIHWSSRNVTTRIRTAIQLELVPRESDMAIYYRVSDNELLQYAIDEETYRATALTRDRPASLQFIGRLNQPNVRFGNEEFAAMAERAASTETE